MLPKSLVYFNTLAVIVFSFLFAFLSYPLKVNADYGEILFQDNFQDNIEVEWTKINESGNTIPLWMIWNGMYGMRLTFPGVGNNLAGDQSWTDYSFEFDMYPYEGVDRNFIFRVQKTLQTPDSYYFYEIHSSGNNITAEKKAPNDSTKAIKFAGLTTYPITNRHIYHWKVTSISNQFTVQIKDENQNNYTTLFTITDDNMPLLNGKIGLRVGAGSIFPSSVYFDNIKVIDLTEEEEEEEPEPTPYPYFSQRDPEWKDNKYDFLNRTIEAVGCALSSAAMVLKSHGLDKIPWGDTLINLNPGTLNDWLNAQDKSDAWFRHGNLNWEKN